MNRISIVTIVMMLSAVAVGDVLVTSQGKSYEGELIRETDEEVVFEVHMKNGLRFEKIFPVDDVMAIEEGKMLPKKPKPKKPEPKGPGYYVIPLVGEVGVEISAEIMDLAIREMRWKKPDIIVLYIDSVGGSVHEMGKILEIIYGLSKKHRVVAYVKEAISAAAIIAMACPEIIIAPDGNIGACVPYTREPDGTPKNIKEKFQSIVRSTMRVACEHGKHPVLLLQGMIDSEIVLGLKKEGDRVTVVKGKGDEVLKPKGKILTLTAKEALRCGLVKSIAKTVHGVPVGLGLKEFRLIRGGAWIAMEKMQKKAREKDYLVKISPQLVEINADIAEVQAAARAAVARKNMLRRQYNAEVKSVTAEYKRNIAKAKSWASRDSAYADGIRYQAQINKENKMAWIRDRYQPQIAALDSDIAKLLQEQRRLNDVKQKLLNAGP